MEILTLALSWSCIVKPQALRCLDKLSLAYINALYMVEFETYKSNCSSYGCCACRSARTSTEAVSVVSWTRQV